MTGVTVAVLAVGLLASGVGTMLFLRNVLVASVDDNVAQLVQTPVWNSLFDVNTDGEEPLFSIKPDAVSTEYFVAIYNPQGERVAVTGGSGAPPPMWPATYPTDQTLTQGNSTFAIPNSRTGAAYRAGVGFLDLPRGELYTQMVALPTASVNSVVGAFLGIYSLLALIVVLAGALLTRYAVTLAFRGLAQVQSTADSIAGGDFSQRMTDVEPSNTEVGRLKTAINAMLGRLDAALAERDATVRQMRRFIGDASHELRTPLVTVRGYAELYRMGAIEGDTDTAQAMDRIEKEAMRMGGLVEDLLALARLDERRDVVVTAVDLRPIARDAALDIRATSPGRTVTVIDTTEPEDAVVVAPALAPASDAVTEAPDAATATPGGRRRGGASGQSNPLTAPLSLLRRRTRAGGAGGAGAGGESDAATGPVELVAVLGPVRPPIVLGDENRIRQVVTNLIGNARRYAPEESPIELRVGVDTRAGMGWIEVADHGEGIPEPLREKIFQRFWRADSSRARETGGSGLGLSIVASIVDLLHGTVSVSETPGGGATFRVGFPLAEPRDAAEHLGLETQPLPRLGSPAS